jgi:TonB family protein
MNESPDIPRLPGYATYLRRWMRPLLRRAFLWSAAMHLVVFAGLGFWWRARGGSQIQPRRVVLREWQIPPRLFLHNVPIILQEGGGGGPDAPPGPGKGGMAVKTPPLAIPEPVPDDEVSNPEATIATQEEAKVAGIVTDVEGDSSGSGGGGGGGGSGGGYGGGVGTGVGEGEGFGQAAFQTPPIPVKIILPGYPRSMGKKVSRVVFLILVDEAGNVVEERVFESSGFAAVDSLAAAAVRQSKFIPARQKGKSIKAWTRYEVSFRRDS